MRYSYLYAAIKKNNNYGASSQHQQTVHGRQWNPRFCRHFCRSDFHLYEYATATEATEERHFIETYTISLVKGFTGDSISLFVNDSLISNKTIIEEPYTVEVGRFAEQSALLIVDNKTELVSTFDLSERGGNYQFEKEEDGIKQLAK